MVVSARLISSAKARCASSGFAEGPKWVSHARTTRIAMWSLHARLRLAGRTRPAAKTSGSMETPAAPTTTATLRHSAGTSTQQISPLTPRDVSINIHKARESTSGGSLPQTTPSMTLLIMGDSARLAGRGTQTEAPLLNAASFRRWIQT